MQIMIIVVCLTFEVKSLGTAFNSRLRYIVYSILPLLPCSIGGAVTSVSVWMPYSAAYRKSECQVTRVLTWYVLLLNQN